MITIGAGASPVAKNIGPKVRRWLRYCHGTKKVEPGYVNVPRRIIVEREILTAEGERPRELCLFVFNGRVRVVQTRATENGRLVNLGFTTAGWTWLRWWMTTPLPEAPPARAKRLVDMIALAERLAEGLDHLRVDFYDCGDTIWIGELTVYSWSGLSPFKPREADDLFGSHWRLSWPLWRAVTAIMLHRREIHPPAAATRDTGKPVVARPNKRIGARAAEPSR
jgi:hypothetical protein